MRQLPLLLIALFVAGSGFFWIRARSRHESQSPQAVTIIVGDAEKHRVTTEMADAGSKMIGRKSLRASRRGTDGAVYELGNPESQRPMVLTFIKKGCPCSEAAQPLFNSLKSAYPDVMILGVIDVADSEAAEWAAKFVAAYPLLPDPTLELMRTFDAQNSAYVVAIDPSGMIVGYWPGYSEAMLRELGGMIAGWSGRAAKPLDLADAPRELFSGCPFDL